jgi:hypothetical protein
MENKSNNIDLKEEIKKLPQKKKEKMSQQEAFNLIQEWGDFLEVRLIEDDFEEVQKEIWKAVQMERLTFDESEEVFKYVLKKPIKDVNTGQNVHTMIHIKESTMREKKEISKVKNEHDRGVALYKTYCTDTDGKEIQIGFLERIYDRDSNIINAIILGFFVQAVPGPVSQK